MPRLPAARSCSDWRSWRLAFGLTKTSQRALRGRRTVLESLETDPEQDPLVEGLDDALAGLPGTTSLEHVSIDGADHFFRDLYAYDVVEAVQAWLEGMELP